MIEAHLAKALRYEPDTGDLYWTEAACKKMRNKRAGSLKSTGYMIIGYAGKFFKAHRVAWLLTHGEWPKQHIDHIDGNPSNNRLRNLRDVDRNTNMHNLHRAYVNSASGLLGAAWDTQAKKWRAQIKRDGKKQYLGIYDTALEAHQVYMKAKAAYDNAV